jgi:hypothetical protein
MRCLSRQGGEESNAMKDAAAEQIGRISPRRLALYFFRLGFLGFGGPVARESR